MTESESTHAPQPASVEPGPAAHADPADPADTAEPTGHPRVEEVVAGLAALDGAPVGEHPAVFENAHARLRETLANAGSEDPDAAGLRTDGRS